MEWSFAEYPSMIYFCQHWLSWVYEFSTRNARGTKCNCMFFLKKMAPYGSFSCGSVEVSTSSMEYIYVYGGQTLGGFEHTLLRYRISTDLWEASDRRDCDCWSRIVGRKVLFVRLVFLTCIEYIWILQFCIWTKYFELITSVPTWDLLFFHCSLNQIIKPLHCVYAVLIRFISKVFDEVGPPLHFFKMQTHWFACLRCCAWFRALGKASTESEQNRNVGGVIVGFDEFIVIGHDAQHVGSIRIPRECTETFAHTKGLQSHSGKHLHCQSLQGSPSLSHRRKTYVNVRMSLFSIRFGNANELLS